MNSNCAFPELDFKIQEFEQVLYKAQFEKEMETIVATAKKLIVLNKSKVKKLSLEVISSLMPGFNAMQAMYEAKAGVKYAKSCITYAKKNYPT